MHKPHLSTAILLALVTSAAVAATAAKTSTASYTPPAQTGSIYTVINYDRAGGRAQHTYVAVDWGAFHRQLLVPAPYGTGPCARTTPSGFVFRLRHNQPDSTPLTITTTGTIVKGPYQGDVPLELLNACYRLVK
jgi:opacity protein-like surface antigen